MIVIGNEILNNHDYYITEKLNGLNTLTFNMSADDDMYSYDKIREEIEIKEGSETYRIKSINDSGSGKVTVTAELAVDAWRSAFVREYKPTSVQSMAATLNAIKPSGWTILDQTQVTKNRKPSFENETALNILQSCIDLYGFAVKINQTSKQIIILNPSNYHAAAYIMEGLNLTKLGYKGSSSDFATRLYCKGADGLTFADINAGKDYVDYNGYYGGIVSAYWEDSRYTDKESLLADAQKKIKELGTPEIEYTVSIKDLAAMSQEYDFLTMGLLSVVRIHDQKRKTSIDMQCIEYKRYPEQPESNELTLSNRIEVVKGTITAIKEGFEDAQEEQRTAVQIALEKLAEEISEAGGLFTTVQSTGSGDIIYLHNKETLESSPIVWKMTADAFAVSTDGQQTWNAGLTADGTAVLERIYAHGINADYINTGTLSADRLGANSITAGKIASGAITADKLSSGTNANLYYTGYDTFEQIKSDTLSYSIGSHITATLDSSTAVYGTKSLKVQTGASSYSEGVVLGHSSNNYGCMRVEAGKTYRLSFYAKGTGTQTPPPPMIMAYVLKKSSIKEADDGILTGLAFTALTGSWARYSGSFTVYAGCSYITLRFNGMQPNQTIWIDGIMVEEQADATKEPSSFMPAAGTVVDGSNIATGTLTADKIAANSIFTQKLTAQNMDITGGSMIIQNAQDYVDYIDLKSNNVTASLSPNYLILRDLHGSYTKYQCDGFDYYSNSGAIVNKHISHIGGRIVFFDPTKEDDVIVSAYGRDMTVGESSEIKGTLTLSKTQDASGTADNKPALIVGGTSTQQHIEIDGNEIMSKSNGNSPATLFLNSDGGYVSVGYGNSANNYLLNVGYQKEDRGDGKQGTSIGAGSIELSHATPYIDFHFNNSTADRTSRLAEVASSVLNANAHFVVSADASKSGSADGKEGVFISGNGGIEISHNTTPYIDFHYGNSTENYTSRIIEKANGWLYVENNYLVEGQTTLRHGYYSVGGLIGASGSNGYILAIRIVVHGSYANAPMSFDIYQRGHRYGAIHMGIVSSADTTPAVHYMYCTGNVYKVSYNSYTNSGRRTVDIYIQKTEAYDDMTVVAHVPQYMYARVAITYPGTLSSVAAPTAVSNYGNQLTYNGYVSNITIAASSQTGFVVDVSSTIFGSNPVCICCCNNDPYVFGTGSSIAPVSGTNTIRVTFMLRNTFNQQRTGIRASYIIIPHS